MQFSTTGASLKSKCEDDAVLQDVGRDTAGEVSTCLYIPYAADPLGQPDAHSLVEAAD